MADTSRALQVGLQVVLAIVIIGLSYWLYLSITEPYAVVERQREVTERTRERMDDVRTALVQFERRHGRFPQSLDSLVTFVKEDSIMQARQDSIFQGGINADSLIYSPRTGRRFEYSVNDTTNVDIYLLEDPDTDDRIGSEFPDVTRLNAASWE
ncbi:MAG: hypothetical protein ACOCSK_00180 [Rhodothermales bacterium]